MENTAAALEVLRALAVDYHVTAEQVDLITELFDDIPHKVPTPNAPLAWPHSILAPLQLPA